MSSIRDVIGESGVEALHSVVESSGNKFLCFTRLTNEAWKVCVSDGLELWMQDINVEELNALREIAEVNTTEAYLGRFKYDMSH